MSGEAQIRPLRPVQGRGVRERDVDLWVVGLNHQTAPVELRERLAIPEDDAAEHGRNLVASRIVHTFIHIGPNRLPLRGAVYGVGVLALFLMWLGILLAVL